MGHRSTLALGFLTSTLIVVPASTQAPAKFTLDIPTIMRGPELYGREPAGVIWSYDSRFVRFTWAPPGTAWNAQTQSYRVSTTPGAVPELVTAAMTDSMTGGMAQMNGLSTRDGKWKLLVSQGSIWLWDVAAGTGKRLGPSNVTPQLMSWSADEKSFFYRTGDVIHSFRIADNTDSTLAAFRLSIDAAASAVQAVSPIAASLVRDQREIFDVIRDGGGGRAGRGPGGGAGTPPNPQTGRGAGGPGRGGAPGTRSNDALTLDPTVTRFVDVPAGATLRTVSMSPSGKALLFITGTSYTSTPTLVPRWVTASGCVENINGRSKVGDAGGTSQISMLDLTNGAVTPLYPIPRDSAGTYTGLSVMGWNETGTTALIRATSGDYKLQVIAGLDPATHALKPLETLRDSTWIGGPSNGAGGWLPGTNTFWFVNESDGYAHVYTMNADGTGRKRLTTGEYEVLDINLSRDRSHFEMHTSEGSPFEKNFFTMNLDGSNRVRQTKRAGFHAVTVSPDGKWYADVYSYSNEPPELYIQAASPTATPSKVTTSPTAAWKSYKWLDPEIIMIPASDGKMVPARIYRPKDVGAKPNGAAVMFIHGAGYLHEVTRGWSSSYPREYMFNHILATKGYVVLDIDYRASAGYGHDWRTAIYKHMGGRDLQDHVDASKWLTKTMGIPGNRIGLYGGSYGGFLTLMGLFTAQDYFGAGAGLRSVTDWAHYNHGYTAPILGLPQDDSNAYHISSPIYFAAGLRAPLLMAHGMVDTNVEFQDIVRLTQRLVELGKKDWTLAPYPVEDHAFTRPDSWTDEYSRILDLFEKSLTGKKK